MSGWACYRCTYMNDAGAQQCAMCLAPGLRSPTPSQSRVSPVNGAPSTAAVWACAACTFENPETSSAAAGANCRQVCGMCGTARSRSENGKPNVDKESANGDKQPVPAPRRRQKRLSSASNIGAWGCPACSAQNVGSALRCELCLASKYRTAQKVIKSKPIASNRADDQVSGVTLFDEITNFCRVNNEKFVDDSFPPTEKNIGDLSGSDDREYVRLRLKEFKFAWLRPEELYTPEGRAFRWAVFRDPKPTDIIQGAVGNCWLMSSLAVVAERPDLLSHIMLTQQYNHLGIYQVRLCVYGSWRTVVIDDLLPARADTHSLAFSQATKNQLWVSLVEKACAKVYGTYAALIAGRSLEGLSTLTGAPCESINLEPSTEQSADHREDDSFSAELVWARLLSCREAGFLMSCSCASGQRNISEVECERVGLLSKHAYSLLDVQHVNGLKLIRLRNPWGHHTWKGPFGNKSDLWTPELRQALKVSSKPPNDGSFWMPFEDFCAYFDTVDVSKVRDDWHEIRLSVACGSYVRTSYSLVIKETTEVDLTIYQDEYRALHKEGGRGELDLCVMIFKHSASAHGVVGDLVAASRRRISAFVSTNALLKPGQYQIVVCTFNHFSTDLTSVASKDLDCQLAVHSSRSCSLDVQPASATLVTDSLIQLAIANARRHVGTKLGVTTYYLSAGFSGLLVVVENRCEDDSVLVVCDCGESSNVVSSREALRTADIIPPLHRQIVMLLTQLEVSANYYVSHQVSWVRHPARHSNTLGKYASTVNGTRASHEPAIQHPLHTPRPMFFH